MNARTHITTAALALAGAGMWYFAGTALNEAGRFENQPNPLGIKRSPYGQVLAMAIQTPIDGDWHGGLEVHDHDHTGSCDHHGAHAEPEDHHASCDHGDCGHDHHASDHGDCDHGGCDHSKPASHKDAHAGHDHDGCDGCGGCGADSPAPEHSLLNRLELAVSRRTNPNPPTAGHQFYLRREIEKKLRFAYELDPSHYANYNSYHLFLTQRQLGTSALPREQVRENANALADHTIRYCLRESHDPRPALTATSAAYNVLEQMLLAEEGDFTIDNMRKQLEVIDFCILQHVELLNASIENGHWELLSPQRQQEVLDRSKFSMKLRDSAVKAIERREADQHTTASHVES